MTPILAIFNPIRSLFYTSFTLYFSIIFHQNVLFNTFEAFCIKFLLDFQSNWPPFSLILDLFDPSFSQNIRSNWIHFFSSCWTRLPKIWWSTPSPSRISGYTHTIRDCPHTMSHFVKATFRTTPLSHYVTQPQTQLRNVCHKSFTPYHFLPTMHESQISHASRSNNIQARLY